jgi:hypothetical protein
MGGRYVDELVRESGGWKIEKRLTVRDWSITHPISADWIGGMDFIAGTSAEKDVASTLLAPRTWS